MVYMKVPSFHLRLCVIFSQISAIYHILSLLVRELRIQTPPAPRNTIQRDREALFNTFPAQYMREVGLDTWVQQQGGYNAIPDPVSEGGGKHSITHLHVVTPLSPLDTIRGGLTWDDVTTGLHATCFVTLRRTCANIQFPSILQPAVLN